MDIDFLKNLNKGDKVFLKTFTIKKIIEDISIMEITNISPIRKNITLSNGLSFNGTTGIAIQKRKYYTFLPEILPINSENQELYYKIKKCKEIKYRFNKLNLYKIRTYDKQAIKEVEILLNNLETILLKN